jgi:hypothetical protein
MKEIQPANANFYCTDCQGSYNKSHALTGCISFNTNFNAARMRGQILPNLVAPTTT